MLTDKSRRQFYAKAGFCEPIPPVSRQRAWEFIDDRIEPDGEPDGQFSSHVEWVNKATSWIGWTGAKCYDAKGRRCRNGADMARARDEGAFPVRWYWPSRYPEPVIPSPGERAALQRLLSHDSPVTLAQVREAPGAGRITWARLLSLLGGGSLEEDAAQKKQLTDRGREDALEFLQRFQRASYVR